MRCTPERAAADFTRPPPQRYTGSKRAPDGMRWLDTPGVIFGGSVRCCPQEVVAVSKGEVTDCTPLFGLAR